jgi:FkbM family methyltransferase
MNTWYSDSFKWPADLKNWRGKAETAAVAADWIARLCPQKRNVIQAGGCSGVWPLMLALHFGYVYTFEPAPTNFACLKENIAATPNISAFNHALYDTRKLVEMTRTKPRAGMWEVDGPGGDSEVVITQAVTLDDFLGDIAVDALVLDVEGSELPAWRGAEKMITKHRPLLWFEFNRNVPALEAWLADHGYARPTKTIGRDAFSIYQQ